MSAERAIDVSELTDRPVLSGLQIRVMALCAAVVMLDGFDTQCIAFVAPMIAESWSLPGGAFGPVFGAGLFGVMIGQLIVGPLSDRYGRRILIIVSCVIFGVLTFATASTTDLTSLLILRLLTGIGLGGAIPNVIALTTEYAPRRLQSTAVMIMLCGFPLGAAVGGLMSSYLMATSGWQAVFYFGGLLPIGLCLVLAFGLPESLRYLVLTNAPRNRISAIVRQLSPELPASATVVFTIAEPRLTKSTLFHLFAPDRARATLLIWLVFFMSLLMAYFLISWIPLVLRQGGLAISTAIMSSVILNVGGIAGAIIWGRLMDRFDSYIVIALVYFAAAALVALIGVATSEAARLMTVLFAAGSCTIGGQIGINAIAARLYPTAMRATGVGMANGMGRIGSVIGPTLGGVLMSTNLSVGAIFALSAFPALVAGAAILALRRGVRRRELSVEGGAPPVHRAGASPN